MKRIVLAAALCSALSSVVAPVAAGVMDEQTYWAWVKEQAKCNADKAWQIYSNNGNTDGCKEDHLKAINDIKKAYNDGGRYQLSYEEFKMLW
ncbi:hypothetical protein X471_00014 [Bartonella bacilliformis str. Heidi Mejia]|uniref:Lipoprotein n=2 Tax=Bartonella bacilliformis TaxID=774 RepID=A1UTM9_BARBK|nr:hypothetical protein [Bartonella bacilliformis]ABM44911.1 hypothetical protein BARBAKC583_1060 [Bartonella bacilliformis KC583]AMG86089.1 hypothetical protein AL467_05020 [Bartonella bacilliformis]EKS43588.1 hypothetical protein BbINS_04972 [Bartonella bacilliformis INS]EYS89586.1 hypothetical protein X472_00016 [Bartonella bacilliformis San Pedro600-02]EYS92526.1 hypothetical protein X471_00014 [Bartonella bacilliformis str. Heidi Mejia]